LQVTLGGGFNRYSLVQNLGEPSEETRADTLNVLSCSAARYMWVWWSDTAIMVGGGDTFTQPFLTHTLPQKRHINYVSLASGEGVKAVFAMAKYNRKYPTPPHRPPISSYRYRA
jgi:hypothetical protein